MSPKEKEIIQSYFLNDISKGEFLSIYPHRIELNYLINSLIWAYQHKDADAVEYFLFLLFDFELFPTDTTKILSDLLEEDWHYKHEDIVTILHQLKSPGCIDALFQTVFKKFVYLDYDDTYSLARKCIHALGEIPTETARERLEVLASTDISVIKENALKQLKKNRI